jgi:proline dehydrogenase
MTEVLARINGERRSLSLKDASELIETLETSLRTIQSAVPKYLKKEMTAEEFALVVIGEADSDRVNKALENSR